MSDEIELKVNGVSVYYQPASGPAPTGPTAPTAPTGPTVPPPPQNDGLDAFRARQMVSQNCAWTQVTGGESLALDAKIGAATRAQYASFYTVGGSGGLGAFEGVDMTSPTGWSFQKWSNGTGASTWDVNQAADAEVQYFATQQGRTVPPPVVV